MMGVIVFIRLWARLGRDGVAAEEEGPVGGLKGLEVTGDGPEAEEMEADRGPVGMLLGPEGTGEAG
jgi:hypothetical protein